MWRQSSDLGYNMWPQSGPAGEDLGSPGPAIDPDCNGHGLRNEDDSFWYGSDGEPNSPSGLSMEWQSRRKQFYNIGYRDGLQEGKEATVQEGFNQGFKQSLLVGYNWGLVRGISSALACLPDDLKEKLVQTPENKDKLHRLYESVHALSTTDALKLFHDVVKNSVDEMVNTERTRTESVDSRSPSPFASTLLQAGRPSTSTVQGRIAPWPFADATSPFADHRGHLDDRRRVFLVVHPASEILIPIPNATDQNC